VLATLGGKHCVDILRPLFFFFGNLEAREINYCSKTEENIAEELRRALLFIIEAATSKRPLSRDTQREMLGPSCFDGLGEESPETYPQPGAILMVALLTAQALGLAEGKVSVDTNSESKR
jgi:hypothetical protein